MEEPAGDERAEGPSDPYVAPGDGTGLRAQKKRRAREAMHRAALELAAEHGAAQVTVEMIAERAQVSPRTFFNYWETKEAALLGLVEDRTELATRLLAERPTAEDPVVSIRWVMLAMARTIPSEPELRLLKKRALDRDPLLSRISMGGLASVQSRLVDEIAERMRLQGIEDPEARAHLLVQLAFAVSRCAFALSMRRGTTPAEELEALHGLLDAGLVRA